MIGNATLLKKEVSLVSGIENYWIVRVKYTYRLTGKEKLTIEQLGSSSNSIMEAEEFAIQALEKRYYENK